MVDQAVHQCHHARRVGEHFTPFCEGFIGGQERAFLLVAATDQLEQQIGIAARIREVPDLVNCQQGGPCVMTQSGSQRRITVQAGKFTEQLAGGGEHDGVPLQYRLVRNVLGDGGLANTGGAYQDGVAGVLHELQRHQVAHGPLVNLLGPTPVVVSQRLEASDVRTMQAPLHGAPGPLLFLPVQQLGDPGLGATGTPVGQQAVELQGLGAVFECCRISRLHRRALHQ